MDDHQVGILINKSNALMAWPNGFWGPFGPENEDTEIIHSPMEFSNLPASVSTITQNLVGAFPELAPSNPSIWNGIDPHSSLAQTGSLGDLQANHQANAPAAYSESLNMYASGLRVSAGSSLTSRLEQCPKCLEFTLRKLSGSPGGKPPSGTRGEVVGFTPEHYEQQHGKKCAWILSQCTCRCSTSLFWTYSLFPESSEELTSSSLGLSAFSATALHPAASATAQRMPARSHPTHSASMSQSSTSGSLAEPLPTYVSNESGYRSPYMGYASYASSEDDSLVEYHAHSINSTRQDTPRSYPPAHQPDDSRDLSQTRDPLQTLSGYASEAAIEGTVRRRKRLIKDNWKYKFHHQYGACAPCRGKRAGCSPRHLDEETLRKVPDEVWMERPYPGWRPHWVPQATPPANE